MFLETLKLFFGKTRQTQHGCWLVFVESDHVQSQTQILVLLRMCRTAPMENRGVEVMKRHCLRKM
jgi:hypothetical protein